ncbi:DUF2865 domain-containing protein [Salinarimonas ramus]|uniref:DUF2865 domain-containing protein n=1 Tax=Salinarimonas ramus TaxID=690164 RepID=A0A917V4V3_9HYPH|nr:DUF2865 domain-containing protein [Salinarimonas ramus]GGK36950.1 hypothetical protein GCM10011322_24930 [Salinarimonas ramus]
MTDQNSRRRAGSTPRANGSARFVARVFGVALLAVGLAPAVMPSAVEATGALDFFRADARHAAPQRVNAPGPVESLFGQPQRVLPTAPTTPEASTSSRRPARVAAGAAGRTMCVRMCDGYYFPVGDLASSRDLPLHDLSCNAGCPGAPTKLFVLAPGEEDISSARAADGMRYADVPMAYSYRTSTDATCSCQGPNQRVADRLDMRHDMTLRRGDIVVTNEGPLVYRGRDGQPEELADFRPFGEAQMASALREKADARLGISARKAIEDAFAEENRLRVDMAEMNVSEMDLSGTTAPDLNLADLAAR